jgi:hypothetical protein
MALARDTGGKYADLEVGDLARRTRVLLRCRASDDGRHRRTA